MSFYVSIQGVVFFSPNNGVNLDAKSQQLEPNDLFRLVGVAFSHLQDKPFVDACCGGEGPLSGLHGEINYEEYLVLLQHAESLEAGLRAKKSLILKRREEFNTSRNHLALAMLEAGVPYVCVVPNCGKIENLTVDHKIPLSRGGSDDLSNLQFMCRPHNSSKSDRKAVSV